MSLRLERREVPRLYVIADLEALAPRMLWDSASEMVAAGVRWIQLRAKGLPDRELQGVLERTVQALEGSAARIWINDRPDLAAWLGVGALHVGQGDISPADARSTMGPNTLIGLSTHCELQVRSASADPEVDLVAIGPVTTTDTKRNPEPTVGLAGVRRARLLTSKPLMAIGGLDERSAVDCLQAGADGVAVIGAICRQADISRACARFLRAVGE